MAQSIIKISGMHCTSCSMVVDGDLEDLNGVSSSQTNFVDQISKVDYDQTQVSLDQIKAVIEQAGYKVISIS
ncbi:MAG: cation transporter [bacterium]|nr:cation transporter [bacterium]